MQDIAGILGRMEIRSNRTILLLAVVALYS
jgi:hypothetical protein